MFWDYISTKGKSISKVRMEAKAQKKPEIVDIDAASDPMLMARQ